MNVPGIWLYSYLTLCVLVKLMKKKSPVWKLAGQVAELEASLEKVKVLLEQQSPTVNEAQHLLKVSALPHDFLPDKLLLALAASFKNVRFLREK